MDKLLKEIERFIENSMSVGVTKIKVTSNKREVLLGLIKFEYHIKKQKSEGHIEITFYE